MTSALHYNDVIMTTMASQITSLTAVYSTVYSDADHRKHQSSASLACVWGIHQIPDCPDPTNYPGMHYNDVIMSTMASQITSLTVVFSTVYSRRRSKKTSKLRVTGLCAENSPVTGEFPAQRPVTRKMFPFDDVIMILNDTLTRIPLLPLTIMQ